ncbi:MAG: Chaperone protein DnaJ [Candidatus Uhrbacteria bacterium GW2011_GWF2_41_16]|uniref:Chaperone protein DnaJ n=2 Tax=Candidatus Uhriibacteriota TaxID=1752732 RepID=A0A0G0YD17_9BACT|nr:MAG: Chaperone protein DnaJ [Candidatus Uhrbacteria bacterium GW2011_GWA2_41_10]KKR86639.1 MAG: Chaperone protein DnaJ [Candidatus Uhrbacteria bacterium GW2011_GWC2_41_11]KKR98217.1 MAG: Chaperone protein DnaJ [Candidatus Uhrbacteria bacterium GW2011_GWF2_41_16]HBP00583.1 molecular chaperone DnaJ [Candidatus Uhrbacteria bacterium]
MSGKDYYQSLGLERNASPEDVKRAFRTLAHKYHPDKPGGNEEKFKEINEAYQVLSDPEKRQKYDQFGSGAFDGGFQQGGAGFNGFDFSGASGFGDLGDIFGDLFGFGGGTRQGSRVRKGNDIEMDVDLSFKESIFGIRKDIHVQKICACEHCHGTGSEPGAPVDTCKTCGGSGSRVTVQRTLFGAMQARVVCESCHGEGKIPTKPCGSCHGQGVVRTKRNLSVDIPSAVEDGSILRLREEGEAVKGGKNGDLFLRLHVKSDVRFEREGMQLFSTVHIGFTQAVLGDSIDVETIDGSVELEIPAGTQSGTEFRLRGKGVPHGNRRGDHIVTVQLSTPRHVSKRERQLLEELNLREK